MFFSKAISGFLFLQLGHYSIARSQTSVTCLTRAECDLQRQDLGFDSFSVGNYPSKGCFSKGGKAYFGFGGTSGDKAESPLSGEKERIWCNATPSQPVTKKPTKAPTPNLTIASQLQNACLTRKECDLKQQGLGFTKFLTSNYPTKGCFSKGDTAYFGIGGTTDQKSESALSGQKQRIWCDGASVIQNILGDTCIDIKVNTDEFGEENGFKLSTNPEDGSTPDILLDFPIGSLKSESEYAKQVCVFEGTYTLTIFGKGSYSAHIAGEEVLFGLNFRWNSRSHNILAGYDPSMSDPEREWLDEHNIRREAYHKEHATEYRPLQWSPELAKDASDWVEKILPTCKVVREPNLEEGENMSVKKYNGPRDNELIVNMLARWSDLKLEREYPDNQTMTQVMWRATRYLGCANKFIKNDDGTYCYVSICRYSRPGNCAVGQHESWLAATLDNHSRCGSACPDEGCH